MSAYKNFTFRTCTHAEVAAKTSIFFAFVMRARAREKAEEKTTINPRRTLLDCTKYWTRTEQIGRIDATTVVKMSRVPRKTDSL